MYEPINERVEVLAQYFKFGSQHKAMPVRVKWNGRLYKIEKIGYYHPERRGRIVVHVYSVATESVSLVLEFNSETLIWMLKEIYDPESTA
jgi:hypothetical protein